MTSLILRIEIGRADIDTPCECSQTRRWSAVGVQTSSAAENCKRAKSDSGAGAKIVHDGPESVFTLARNGRSRCAGIGVHVGPENAQVRHGRDFVMPKRRISDRRGVNIYGYFRESVICLDTMAWRLPGGRHHEEAMRARRLHNLWRYGVSARNLFSLSKGGRVARRRAEKRANTSRVDHATSLAQPNHRRPAGVV